MDDGAAMEKERNFGADPLHVRRLGGEIGTRMELRLAENMLVPSIPHKMMDEVKKTLGSWANRGMVPLRDVRAVTG